EVKDTSRARLIEDEAESIIRKIIRGEETELPEDYREWVMSICSRCNFTGEAEAIMRALSGEYVRPSRGGDPVKDPETYPTGYSMYAFDPMKIPTAAAESR